MHSSVYISINLLIVNSQLLKCSAVNGQNPEKQHGQWSNHRKELVKVLTCGRSCDYGVYKSDTHLVLIFTLWVYRVWFRVGGILLMFSLYQLVWCITLLCLPYRKSLRTIVRMCRKGGVNLGGLLS